MIEYFEFEFEVEFAEVSWGPEGEVIWQDYIVVSEGELYLSLIDSEDIPEFGLI